MLLCQALFIDDRRDRLAHWSFIFMERFPSEANTSQFHFNLAMTLYGLQVTTPAIRLLEISLSERNLP
jgi:hypothetical protein